MGARQYSPLLGRFLEVDPVPGGNANDYAYPTDPVNMSDLDGRCWGFAKNAPGCVKARRAGRWVNRNRAEIGKWALRGLTVAAAGFCIAASGGACIALTVAVMFGSTYKNAGDTGVLGKKKANWGRFIGRTAIDVGMSLAGGLPAGVVRSATAGSLPLIARQVTAAHGQLPTMVYGLAS